MKSIRCILFFFLLVATNPCFSDVVTYNVDLSGTDSDTGALLEVIGTIDAETSDSSIVDGDLGVYLQGSFVSSFMGTPNVSQGSGFEWQATPTELRFIRLDSSNSFTGWDGSLGGGRFLGIYFGNTGSTVYYATSFTDGYVASLEPTPISSSLLVGTATAVPEPSAMACMGLVGGLVLLVNGVAKLWL